MIKSASIPATAASLAVLLAAQAATAAQPAALEASDGRWYVSPAVGFWNFEGDEPLEDGFYGSLRVGYDYSEWWMFELNAIFAPSLDENTSGNKTAGGWGWDDGTGYRVHSKPQSKSKGDDRYFDHTWGLQLYADAMLHFTSWDRLDPYLIFGVGLETFGKDVMEDDCSLNGRVGGGVMYHIDDTWTLRADTRINLAGYNTEFNHTIDVGVIYRFGASAIKDDLPPAAPLDSDGDGLLDEDEIRLGTDPNNPDTDGDGLLDGDEVKKLRTDPLNPDSDYDMLSDGYEVLETKTDPLDPDTDKGGVRDGHEFIYDKTDPLDPSDDILFFELNINFDTDKDVIKPEFFEQLDKVADVMLRNPGSTAVVEGHADKRQTSKRNYNITLSQKRAQSVSRYLQDKGIGADRIKAIGYGFDHPKAANDPVSGNLANRRVEVYIDGVKTGKVNYVNPGE